MKKRFLIILFTLIISVASVFPAYAGTSPRLVDNAGLLSSYEKQSLEAQLDKISEKYSFDVVIVTANTLGGKSAKNYAGDYYVDNGYGFSDSKDGIIFIVAMREREWFMMPFGYGNTAFTDDGLMSIEDRVIPYLSDADYEYAFSSFATLCDRFLSQAQKGEPYGETKSYKDPFPFMKYLLISLVIGVVLALITLSSMKSKLKTVRPQNSAATYTRDNSMEITNSRDFFLYRNVRRTAIPQNNSSRGGSSRGSSRGSGGGRGGRF